MPIYDYECREHGSFELARPMSESAAAARCPECGGAARRLISAPQLRTLAPLIRSSMERNEKSRHAPHVCGAGCGHAAPSGRERGSSKGKMVSYRGPRPWVVEHA